jgi:hypothetical protein
MDRDEQLNAEGDVWLATAGLATLPREADAGDLLEERTVRALRAAGLLGRRPVISRTWIGIAAAAAIALFASGLTLGQWLGSRSTATIMAAQHDADLQHTATIVEQAGEAYVNALSALAEAPQPVGSVDVVYARETALSTLHQAANQLLRIAPNDPVAASILRALDQASDRPLDDPKTRRVIWF